MKVKTLQFLIVLQRSQPLVWRRFLVSDDYRLDRFHQVIQIVMGWQNSHLHTFTQGKKHYGMVLPYDDFDPPLDETQYRIRDLKLEPSQCLGYLYDFGDDWQHQLILENDWVHWNKELPVCLAGERACPMEDCGGIDGYHNLLEIMANPKHPEFKDWNRWVNGRKVFDYDLEATNRELAKFGQWHKKHPLKKSTPWHQLD